MPFETWLPYFGISATLIMILVPFWKADELLSDAARTDVANYLLRVNDHINYDIRSVVNDALDKIYGRKYIGLRSFIISTLITTVVMSVLFLILAKEFEVGDIRDNSYSGTVIQVLVILVIINIVFDYISIIQSRITLNAYEISQTRALVMDFLFSSAICAISLYLYSFIIGSTNELVSFQVFNSQRNIQITRLETPFIASAIMSTYLTSAWAIVMIIGSVVISFANRYKVIFWIQYVLPIEKSPLRSIGIAASLFLTFIFCTWAGLQAIIGLSYDVLEVL